jgi:hypothetical protein
MWCSCRREESRSRPQARRSGPIRSGTAPLADALTLERAEVVDHLMSAAGGAAIAAFTGTKSR